MKFSELAERLHGAIHNENATHASGPAGPIPVSETSHGIRYVDVDLVGYSTLRFIAQNPRKDSRPASLARSGHQITWVVSMPGFQYKPCGVVDGAYEPDIHRALQKIKNAVSAG
jgi:hypothetical protein